MVWETLKRYSVRKDFRIILNDLCIQNKTTNNLERSVKNGLCATAVHIKQLLKLIMFLFYIFIAAYFCSYILSVIYSIFFL